MKNNPPSILLLTALLLSLSCSSLAGTATRSGISGDSPSADGKKTESAPVEIDMQAIQDIVPSPIPGDGRIWAMQKGASSLLTSPTETRVLLTIGPFYVSEDDGRTWRESLPSFSVSIIDPTLFSVASDFAQASDALLFPTSFGYILQLRESRIPSISQKPSTSLLFRYSADGWSDRIVPPTLWDYCLGDCGIVNWIVLPGSGDIVAVGQNPLGSDNAWILQAPYTSWRGIPADPARYKILQKVVWSDAHGVVAVSEYPPAILQLDNREQWREIGPFVGELGEYGDTLWIGLNGEICLGTTARRPGLVFKGWEGSAWQDYPEGSACALSIVGRNSIGMGVSNSFLFELEYFPRSTFTVFQPKNDLVMEIHFPSFPKGQTVKDLEGSGTGVLYFLLEKSLYRSMDLGETWELLAGKDSISNTIGFPMEADEPQGS